MKNGKNGITLIALVITIIVMLILVSVTITMAINGGLFEYAGRAVSETENAKEQEQGLANGGIEIGGIWYESIDDYLTQHGWEKGTTFETRDTFTCSHCDATYTMGDVVNYTPTGNTSATITAEKSGDSSDQTIKKQDATWIVLGIEDTDGNGTNETLLITTQAPVGIDESNNELCLYGAEAYNNGPSEINRICEELYSNSEYGKARGMKIDDVNSALNVDLEEFGLGGMYTDDGSTWKTTGNLTTKLNGRKTDGSIEIDLQTLYNSYVAKERTQTPDGRALEEYELNGYLYYLNDEGIINDVNTNSSPVSAIEKTTIFGESRDYVYWLASRGVYASFGYAIFGPGYVEYGDANSYFNAFNSKGNEYNINAALRPVVSLKSKIPAIVEDET